MERVNRVKTGSSGAGTPRPDNVSPEEHKRLAQSVRHFIWWNTYGYSMDSPFARAEFQIRIDDFHIHRVRNRQIVGGATR